MRALRIALAGVVLSAIGGFSAAAQTSVSATPWTELHASRVRLIAGRASTPEGRYWAGLQIEMPEGWKTYWRMPGDSGVPPTFDWAGSVNLSEAKVRYPAPQRMPEAGGEAIGYKHTVLLPIEIAPQDASKPVMLKLALEFGVCREICIPASATFSLSLSPAPAGAPPAEIAAALERVPRGQEERRKGDPDLKRIMVSRDGAAPKLVVEAAFPGNAKSADVFVEAPEGLYIPLPKRDQAEAAGVVRFESRLDRDLLQDLDGKTLRVTLVGEAGASEAQWVFR